MAALPKLATLTEHNGLRASPHIPEAICLASQHLVPMPRNFGNCITITKHFLAHSGSRL